MVTSETPPLQALVDRALQSIAPKDLGPLLIRLAEARETAALVAVSGSPLVLPRGGGVTVAPAAKLPVAPDMVHRSEPVNRTARRPSELGTKLGPPSVARPSSGCR